MSVTPTETFDPFDRRGRGRRESDRRLRLDADRLRTAFVSAPNGIALLDRGGAIVGVNPSLCSLFGCAPEDLLGVELPVLVHPADADGVRHLLCSSVRRPRSGPRLEVRCVLADSSLRWAELSVAHVQDDEAEDWAVAQIQDVDNRHEAEQRLRHSEERNAALAAELARRNTELHDTNVRLRSFASLASHDLSGPLASISGVLALVERHGGDRLDPRDRELLAAGRERAESMRGLVQDMLSYARDPTTLKLADVDLRALVDEALRTLGEGATGRDPLVTIGALPTVRCDRQQLLRVMRNILGNAVKYVEPGARPALRVEALRRTDSWEIAVTDNGPGVADSDRERIFNMLERAHGRSVPGSGLGLGICAEVVARHGGEIWVESAQGGGSRFAFTLPDDPPAGSDGDGVPNGGG